MDAEFDIRYTDRSITPFGGLTTVKAFYKNSGLKEVISSLPLPQPGSNRGYNPVDIIEGFLVSVILGARRLAHAGLLWHDKVVSENVWLGQRHRKGKDVQSVFQEVRR